MIDNKPLPEFLHKIFLRSPLNLFDEFIEECKKWYEQPAHTFTEMRNRDNKKVRGDIFEEFCVLYLKHISGNENVWLLKDVPVSILDHLKLKRRDMGIDIVVENNGLFQAVQCKYKKHLTIKKNVLSWKCLSTFYAICLRTGPWNKYIIMTNCDYTRHQGIKTEKDISICLKTLQNINKDNWLKMCNVTSNKLGKEEDSMQSLKQSSDSMQSSVQDLVQRLPRGLGYLHPYGIEQIHRICNIASGLPISSIPDMEPLDLLKVVEAFEKLPIKKDKSKKIASNKQPKISKEQLRNIRISFFDKKEDNEKVNSQN